MALLVVLLIALVVAAESQGIETQGFLSNYLPAGTDALSEYNKFITPPIDLMNQRSGLDASKRYAQDRNSVEIISDSPFANFHQGQAAQASDPVTFTSAM